MMKLRRVYVGLMMTSTATVWMLVASAIVVVAAADNMKQVQRTFTDALTTELYENENECSSSLGVSMAFGLIYPASTGDSKQQMRDVFGYSDHAAAGGDPLVWAADTEQLNGIYQGQCLYGEEKEAEEGCKRGQNPLLSIANSIWVRNNVPLNSNYAQVVGDFVKPLDFDQADAGKIVNDWVKEHTQGLIDAIVPDGRLPWVMAAINAIYLKASWLKPFKERMTSEDRFYTSPLRSTPADKPARFMHQTNNFEYAETGTHQILRLSFSGDNVATRGLSMIFVLPNTGLSSVSITAQELWLQMSKLELTRVAMAIPQFQFESTYGGSLMKESLKATGLEAPFDGELCVQHGDVDCQSSVDFVIQKTFIDVNEKGVEAAAATLLALDRSSLAAQKIFLCDHPFQFFIYDSNIDAFLFEGRVSNPGIPNGAPVTPGLQASHEDSEFWRKYLGADLLGVSQTPMAIISSKSSSTEGVYSAAAAAHRPTTRLVTLFLFHLLLVSMAMGFQS